MVFSYLHSAYHNPARIIKLQKVFESELNFKDIKFIVTIRDACKTENIKFIDISVFGYENNTKYPIYVPKKCFQTTC